MKGKYFIYIITAVLGALLLSSCTTTETRELRQHISTIKIGMTQQEVIKQLGKPQSISAKGNQKALKYFIEDIMGIQQSRTYFVKLQNNKVIEYGATDDFNHPVQIKENIDVEHKIK